MTSVSGTSGPELPHHGEWRRTYAPGIRRHLLAGIVDTTGEPNVRHRGYASPTRACQGRSASVTAHSSRVRNWLITGPRRLNFLFRGHPSLGSTFSRRSPRQRRATAWARAARRR